MVKLTIDGQSVEVEEGTTVLAAAKALEIDIPTLCYSDFLEPYAGCRMCTVKVGGGDGAKLTTSCNLAATEGMVVVTGDEDVRRARRLILELLLAKAPSVERLQELGVEYGADPRRFGEPTEEALANRCILCGLCTRICQQRVKAFAISINDRGQRSYVSAPYDALSPDCIACGSCSSICPTGSARVYDRYDRKVIHPELSLASNSAVRFVTKQMVPNVPTVYEDDCIHFRQSASGNAVDACRICEEACGKDAVSLDSSDEEVQLDVGTIIVATGMQVFDPSVIPALGYRRLPNVITGMEFEFMARADGVTGGHIELEDGRTPEAIAIVHCVGSRDERHHEYCSRVCCMYSLKFAHLVKEHTDAEVYNFYIDMRAFGKGYEEFYKRLLSEGVHFIRGKVAEVMQAGDGLMVIAEDTLLGTNREVPVDMVILSTALEARSDAEDIRRVVGIGCGSQGFFQEMHPKLAPVATTTDGVFIAGACQGPKDIPDSVAQGAAAAAEALSLIGQGQVAIEPITSTIDEDLCSGCRYCIQNCPYTAISYDTEKKISVVNGVLCKGCGTCVAGCPSGAARQRHYSDTQIYAELGGMLRL
ncbi:MAG: hypothetical protein A2Y64_07275 [Candidatus Coatesbacteria bacterium RBG_13_66_14]|uniref:Ferredoxin n=1 Tax=Candidatus Coatesbacteria bacterium RBG_13_66_14 TaxID=1817816 RepID=A0A1F5F2K2_9BACT|nr:MAG: hypothetical protein A2Y64_07275 [Candidatus Coatesbacteria bacterium RBG_13_66_14]